MTTKRSPLHQLQQQAQMIASLLKRAERGEPIPTHMAHKIAEARLRPTFKTGIVMDDKVITIEMPWTKVAETTEPALVEYILDLMRESRTPDQ